MIRILIVEDEITIARLIDLLDPAALRDEGYDWDAEAYPSNPAPEPEEPTEP